MCIRDRVADHIIDLGPEGGSGGGQLVACGTPEQIAACPESFTGQYLKKMQMCIRDRFAMARLLNVYRAQRKRLCRCNQVEGQVNAGGF